MSKQVSIIKLKGTIDGITFYQRAGQYFARKATSLDKNRIASDPNFVRTRENDNEFGGCASVTKSFRRGFAEMITSMPDMFVTGRLVKLFKEINILADGVRGERPVNLSEHKEMIEGFEFNDKTRFSGIFTAPFTVAASADRTSSTLNVVAFNPANYVKAPKGATHFRLINYIAVLSDFQANATSKKYYPVDALNDTLNAVTFSDYFPVDVNIPAPTTVVATLPGAPVLPANVSVLNAVGIEFYQEINLKYYLFAQDNCMLIERAF
ncbi:MAG: hypothetical protein Q8880_05075 [Bacteroidota bacterium]|nr:hypothetical protein [Bacteroidota bacterium]